MRSGGLAGVLNSEAGKALETARILFQPGSLERFWRLPEPPSDPAFLMEKVLFRILNPGSNPIPEPAGFSSLVGPGDRAFPASVLRREPVRTGPPDQQFQDNGDAAPSMTLPLPDSPSPDARMRSKVSLQDPAIPASLRARPSDGLAPEPETQAPLVSQGADPVPSLFTRVAFPESRPVRRRDQGGESLSLPDSPARPLASSPEGTPSVTSVESALPLRADWPRPRSDGAGENADGRLSDSMPLPASPGSASAPVLPRSFPVLPQPVRGAFSAGALSALLQGQVETAVPGETALPSGFESGPGPIVHAFQARWPAPIPDRVPGFDFAPPPGEGNLPDEDALIERLLEKMDNRAREESIRRYGISGGLV